MKKEISIFKKIKLFNNFKKIINQNKSELELKFNIRVDGAKRLYTVLNVPNELIGEAYSLKRSDIDRISENYIRQYSTEVGEYLNSKSLKELYDFYKIEKIGKYSYLIVFGFSLFKSNKYYNTIYYGIIPTLLLSSILLFLLMF
jgi:hypothetical protein